MEVRRFLRLLRENNAIRLNDDYILFNDLELYNLKTEQEIHFNDVGSLLKHKFQGSTLEEFIIQAEDFYNTYDGGRGASSEAMGGGFGHDRRGSNKDTEDDDIREAKFPAEFNVGGKNRSYEKTLDLFQRKYNNADHEYAISVDEMGFVHRHVAGGKSSVRMSPGKNHMVVHNHPGGGNFSDTDLISAASSKARGVVATGPKKTYTFKKSKNFKPKPFTKALKKAKWPAKYDYDKGVDWWLKRNAKKYGYEYYSK